MQKARDMKMSRGHRRCLLAALLAAIEANSKNKKYPTMPQTGTGKPSKMEYGLWETVSQLIALEMAQKLRYPISV